jgi:hypothetical protein
MGRPPYEEVHETHGTEEWDRYSTKVRDPLGMAG